MFLKSLIISITKRAIILKIAPSSKKATVSTNYILITVSLEANANLEAESKTRTPKTLDYILYI